MSSAPYPSTYAARSAAAYNTINTNMGRNPNGQPNMAPRVGTFPSAQGNPNYNQDYVVDQQSRILDECSRRVQEQAYYMRRAMDEDDLSTALERATFMLSELGAGPHHSSSNNNNTNFPNSGVSLGSSKLSPKNYYELQMKAMDEMPNLEEFFLALDVTEEIAVVNTPPPTPNNHAGYFAGIVNIPDINSDSTPSTEAQTNIDVPSKPDPLMELYETVQYCPRVLPRLYLQICAGTALLRSRGSKTDANSSKGNSISVVSVMKDLMDHVKCVQCPIRGLFLRNYVLQIFKYPMDESLEDLYTHLLQNFVEMNQLWVRIQHLPSSKGNHVKADKKERRRREKERNELRLLVGTNLVRLSQLDGITPALYKEKVLPPILEQIVSCKDALAQAYLMDCIIQVFPDDFHIETLSIFVDVLPRLKEKVNVRTIMQGMMERLSNYYTSNAEVNVSIETFEVLNQCVQTVSSTRTAAAQNQNSSKSAKPNHSEIIHLQTYLFQFSLQHFPDQFLHLNQILNQCADTLNIFCATAPMDDTAMADLEKLLMIPLQKLSLKILELNSFGSLLEFLPWEKRKKVGKGLIQAVIAEGKGLKDVEKMESLLKITTPLLKDVPDHMNTQTDSMNMVDDTETEQNWVSKLVHLYYHEDTDVMFQMFNITNKYFSEAGKGKIESTLGSLVFATLKLVKRIYTEEFKEEPPEKEDKEIVDQGIEEDQTKEIEEDVEKINITKDETPEEGNAEIDDPEKTKEDEDSLAKDENVDNEGNEPEKAEEHETVEKKIMDEIAPEEETAEPSLFDEPKPVEESIVASPQVYNKLINCRKAFLFLQKIVSPITQVNPRLAYQLYLQIATMASSFSSPSITTDFNAISYEYIVQAFSVYENEISDATNQLNAMTAMVGTLLVCRGFSPSEFGALVTKTAQYSARLLKKPDQCMMVTLCSHLFYIGEENDASAYRNPQRVLECLQRSLKLADACTTASPSNVHLFVDILDHYVFYFEKGTPLITDRFVTGLIALINEHLAGSNDEEVLSHFLQIVKYIKHKKANRSGSNAKFASIAC